MPKSLWNIVLMLSCFCAFSQNTVTVKGKAIDNTSQLPLESATVYLTTVKDSTMIDYTITDKNGNFTIKTRKLKQAVFLKVSFMGFKDYKQELASLENDKDFGSIKIEENASLLGEVVIKSEAPPVRIKKDTLEFNAASFKVRPDANVEALLKQLPGVEIDANGKITVNGKEVNNILVNGKPFFGKDGKVATENLPSDIIDKVQITDTKTKQEELTGEAASSNEKTINLTIQEDKNKGLFGKFAGGVGSDDRYESSGLINWFKDKQKFSFLGASNNINSIGFSMDEVFDSMGGGRNIYTSSDGSFNIDGQQFGGQTGITQSNMIGLNYTDEYLKKMETSGSYFYNSAETNNDNRSLEEQYQTNGSTEKSTTASQNSTRRTNNGHNLTFEYEYKIDSLTTISIRPNIRKSNSRFTSNRMQETRDENEDLLNDSQSYSNNDTHNSFFENSLYFIKKGKKKFRSFSVWFTNENKDDDQSMQTISLTNEYAVPKTTAINQFQNTGTVSDKYESYINFAEPISDSMYVSTGVRLKSAKQINKRRIFDYDAINDDYSDFNAAKSNYINSETTTIAPYSGLRIRKKNINGGITLGAKFIKFGNYSERLGTREYVNKDYVYPSVDGYLNYTISKSKSLYANYNYEVEMPNGNQLLDFNNVDPLATYTGEPNLKPQETHNIHIGYNNYDYATRSGFYFYSGGGLQRNQVVSNEVFTASLAREITFANVDNTYYTYFGFDYSKSHKKEKNTFKYTIGLNSNINLSKGFTNNAAYQSHTYYFTPRLELSYEYGDFLTIMPSYNFEIRNTNFTNFAVSSQSNTVHTGKIEITTRWPQHFVFGNDFGYTYNSMIGDGFKKDFYLWNSSLGYNFFKDKLLAKVKVYDILNQNISSTRQITSSGFRDEQNTVLKRYVMFSLTYKIEKFGGKKKREWD